MRNLKTKISVALSSMGASALSFAEAETSFADSVDTSSAITGIETAGLAVLGLVLVVVGIKVVIKMVKSGASA